MKKKSSIFTLIIGVSILLSSCSSNKSFTFTKRHYTSGYYVDRVGKVNTPKSTSTNGSIAISSQSNEKLVTTDIPIASSDKVSITTPINKSGLNTVAIAKETTKGKSSLTVSENNEIAIPVKTLSNESKINQVAESITSVTDRQDRENARSLFWLVITILLILWLIAILSGDWGIGPIINVLLIVALILLVLWLLRII